MLMHAKYNNQGNNSHGSASRKGSHEPEDLEERKHDRNHSPVGGVEDMMREPLLQA